MRYERLAQVLDLALELQASRRGLTLADIQERFGVGRRTAERHLEALEMVFGWMETVESDDRRKHWRMRAPSLRQLVRVSPDELAELNAAPRICNAPGWWNEPMWCARWGRSCGRCSRVDRRKKPRPTSKRCCVAEGNANPQKDVTQEYDVPPATRRLIERNNEQDLEIYERGKLLSSMAT